VAEVLRAERLVSHVGLIEMKGADMHHRIVALASLVLLAACQPATTEQPTLENSVVDLPQEIDDIEGIEGGGLFLDDFVYVSGQPSESALVELKERGVSVVVNARTPKEVADREKVPFDEEQVVRDLGMTYVSIPLGGNDFPYQPEALKRFSQVLADNDGKVLVHCTYGGRAAYLWVAYLVEHGGLMLEEAMARGEAMMLKPHPVGRLLGKPTRLVMCDSPRESQ
jgi:uncharacterized protein (TIGR01244 family)